MAVSSTNLDMAGALALLDGRLSLGRLTKQAAGESATPLADIGWSAAQGGLVGAGAGGLLGFLRAAMDKERRKRLLAETLQGALLGGGLGGAGMAAYTGLTTKGKDTAPPPDGGDPGVFNRIANRVQSLNDNPVVGGAGAGAGAAAGGLAARSVNRLIDNHRARVYEAGRPAGFFNSTAEPSMPERIRGLGADTIKKYVGGNAATANALVDSPVGPALQQPQGILGRLGMRTPQPSSAAVAFPPAAGAAPLISDNQYHALRSHIRRETPPPASSFGQNARRGLGYVGAGGAGAVAGSYLPEILGAVQNLFAQPAAANAGGS